jgi:L-seryl-tRNA(Ser) seleniumtransferase
VKKIERDPLMRAFRLDKMTLAALEATLRLYLNEERALADVPILRMLGLSTEDLRQRAAALAERLRAISRMRVGIRNDVAYVGGGSLPDRPLATAVIEISSPDVSDAELAARLRMGTPAVLGRVQDGKVLLDVRTVFDDQFELLVEAVGAAVRGVGGS